jgi:hypothetical protein
MNTSDPQVHEAEAWLKRTAESLDAAQEERDRAIRETASIVNRRKAGELTGLTSSGVQQIINAPWTHRVQFVGVVGDKANKALRKAGIELRTSRGGGAPAAELPPPTKHSVYLKAESSKEALERVERTLESAGSFAAYKVNPVSPSRRR